MVSRLGGFQEVLGHATREGVALAMFPGPVSWARGLMTSGVRARTYNVSMHIMPHLSLMAGNKNFRAILPEQMEAQKNKRILGYRGDPSCDINRGNDSRKVLFYGNKITAAGYVNSYVNIEQRAEEGVIWAVEVDEDNLPEDCHHMMDFDMGTWRPLVRSGIEGCNATMRPGWVYDKTSDCFYKVPQEESVALEFDCAQVSLEEVPERAKVVQKFAKDFIRRHHGSQDGQDGGGSSSSNPPSASGSMTRVRQFVGDFLDRHHD